MINSKNRKYSIIWLTLRGTEFANGLEKNLRERKEFGEKNLESAWDPKLLQKEKNTKDRDLNFISIILWCLYQILHNFLQKSFFNRIKRLKINNCAFGANSRNLGKFWRKFLPFLLSFVGGYLTIWFRGETYSRFGSNGYTTGCDY